MKVIEILFPILQKDADRFPLRLANQGWILMASANVREATDITDDFAK